MAWLFKRGSKWGIAWREGSRQVRRIIGTRTEAKQMLDELNARDTRSELGLEKPREVVQVPVEQWFNEYSIELKQRCNPKHVYHTLYNIRRFIEHVGVRYLDEIRPDHWLRFADACLSDRTKATRNRYIASLKRFFRRAIEVGYLDRSPVQHVHQLREELPPPSFLSEQEEQALLEASKEYAPLFRFLTLTGIRRGELVSLASDDISLHDRMILVRHPKTGRSRVVPLSEEALALAEEIRSKATRPAAMTLSNVFRRIAAKAGLPPEKRHLHVLRHTFATRLAAAGVPLNVVQTLLGHSTIVMTTRYAHAVEEHLRAAVERAGRDAMVTQPVKLIGE